MIKQEYINWILSKKNDEFTMSMDNDNIIDINTEYGIAKVVFTDIDDGVICELAIESKKDSSNVFYLHFELKDEEHCKDLFEQMIEALLQLKDKRKLEVLLSCTSGLTTGMFAELLNNMADQLGLDYHFNAVSYINIYEEAIKSDVVMIAPQIGYMLNRLREGLSDKLVFQIPAKTFAKYDAFEAIEYLREQLYIFKKKKKKSTAQHQSFSHNESILTIAMVANEAQARLYYRYIKEGKVVDENEIIRPEINYNDIDDIIDTILVKYKQIDIIGIGVPGVINNKGEIRIGDSEDDIPLLSRLKDKYGINIVLENNANITAFAFHKQNSKYKNILYHTQPFGYSLGGQGVIIDGNMVRGKNGIVGEIKFFLRRMQLSDEPTKLRWTETGTLELVTKSLLPAIIAYGPEVVVVHSPLTPNMDEIKVQLSSFIPDEYMPEFVYIKEDSELMLQGMLERCIEVIDGEKNK